MEIRAGQFRHRSLRVAIKSKDNSFYSFYYVIGQGKTERIPFHKHGVTGPCLVTAVATTKDGIMWMKKEVDDKKEWQFIRNLMKGHHNFDILYI